MRLMFVYYAFEDQGSGLVIQGYSQAARALGHEVVVYGREHPRIPLNYSLDVASADAVVFIFEWTTQLRYADLFDLARIVASVPRERRVIIDGDGNYNDVVRVKDDYNHVDAAGSREWMDRCRSLTDKICQPTLHPLRDDVLPFLFYAYNPSWERLLVGREKDFGMVYVGHCKFRWQPMHTVLSAIAPVRDRVGRIALVGEGWGHLPWWAGWMHIEDHYFSDPEYLDELGVEVMPPVPFVDVLNWMGKGSFNPVLLRPTFRDLHLVSPRMFETTAAGTIPLFNLDPDHVKEIYGEAALELVLGPDGSERITDMLDRPDHYTEVVRGIREHLTRDHSHAARLRQLIEIVEA